MSRSETEPRAIAHLSDGTVEEMRGWRRWLHRRPELEFAEHETSDFVAERLSELGIEHCRGMAGSGIVGVIRGERVGKRSIGLRADMDALPIEEGPGREDRSTHPGCVHACGHDGHTTMLLGAAAYLATHRNFEGNVHLIFQPAEEAGVRRVGEGSSRTQD